MSCCICRVAKIKKASGVAGIQIHNRREREHSNTNPDIDFERSHLNYSLIDTPNRSYNAIADERIANGYKGLKAIRKDAVRVCEVLFTSDTDFFINKSSDEQRQYFTACLNWANGRFGKENIIAATVHMDEATPHMHLDFVPLTKDGRLTAKDVLGNKYDLQLMQDDFYNTVGKPWGLERGERADLDNPEAEKPQKHKTTAEYKRQMERETADLAERVNGLTEKEKFLRGVVDDLESKFHKKQREFLSGELFDNPDFLSKPMYVYVPDAGQYGIIELFKGDTDIAQQFIMSFVNNGFELLPEEKRRKYIDKNGIENDVIYQISLENFNKWLEIIKEFQVRLDELADIKEKDVVSYDDHQR